MGLLDLILQYKLRVNQRILYKTQKRSISLEEESDCFKELADMLLIAKPVDANKIIDLQQEQAYTINWKTDLVPAEGGGYTEFTYSQLFGNYPQFTVEIFSTDTTSSDGTGIGVARVYDEDGVLETVDFDLGPFLINGRIIIS
jgi:hypothetical protein